MKVFTNNKFNGYYPVGSAAIIIASNKEEAAGRLSYQLNHMGLAQQINPDDMVEINIDSEKVIILCDGEY